VFAEISRKSAINQGNSNVGINRRDPGDFLITYRLTVKSSPCVRFPYEVLKKRIMGTAVNRGGGLPTAVPCANPANSLGIKRRIHRRFAPDFSPSQEHLTSKFGHDDEVRWSP
jgi:hypothetical protein